MDANIQTALVSIVKEEDIEIKEELIEDYEHYNREIKEDPIGDYEHYNREEKCGVLGNFYEVECNGGPEECMVEGEEEEVLQKNINGCACSKDLERLESRMGRLECLLELLVSKVASSHNAASPRPALTFLSPKASEKTDCHSSSSSNGK